MLSIKTLDKTAFHNGSNAQFYFQARAFTTVTVPNYPGVAGGAGGVAGAIGAAAAATVQPPPNYGHNIVAIAPIGRRTRLLLACSDGFLYIYDLPGESNV